ncbi:unnamed protein product [Arabidopsis halleri]
MLFQASKNRFKISCEEKIQISKVSELMTPTRRRISCLGNLDFRKHDPNLGEEG